MSDMQFRAVRKRADKSESEKATVSESVVRIQLLGTRVAPTGPHTEPNAH